MTTTPNDTCPEGHVPSGLATPVHCPPWCGKEHDPILWHCCGVVVHSLDLSMSEDGRTSVRLTAAETPYGMGAEALQIATDPDLTLSNDEADALSRLLADAVALARSLVVAK